jgi:hypothetical protein
MPNVEGAWVVAMPDATPGVEATHATPGVEGTHANLGVKGS